MEYAENDISEIMNALARHALHYLRLYSRDGREGWRGEADKAQWSSSCAQTRSPNIAFQEYMCSMRVVQMCFIFMEDASENSR